MASLFSRICVAPPALSFMFFENTHVQYTKLHDNSQLPPLALLPAVPVSFPLSSLSLQPADQRMRAVFLTCKYHVDPPATSSPHLARLKLDTVLSASFHLSFFDRLSFSVSLLPFFSPRFSISRELRLFVKSESSVSALINDGWRSYCIYDT